jgi:tetratricopeptide (TPR) repeat protein
MYQRALAGKEKAWGPEHASTLDMVNNLGALYTDLGMLEEAEEMYQRALGGYEKALGVNDVTTHIPALNTTENLGLLFERQAEIMNARIMYTRALVGSGKVLGLEHPRPRRLLDKLRALHAITENNASVKVRESANITQPEAS